MRYLRIVKFIWIRCVTATVICPIVAFAATPNISQQELQSVIQDQQLQERLQGEQFEQFRQERDSSRDIFTPVDKHQALEGSNSKGVCFDITSIQTSGVSLLKQSEVQAVTNPYVGQCVDIAAVQRLAQELTALYVDKGYITSQFSIPEQNLKSGKLSFAAIEGYVDGWKVQAENDGLLERRLSFALPLKQNGWLNLRATEQGLENLSRVRSTNAKIDMLPGEKLGGTVLAFTMEETKPWRVITSLDNNGSKNSGEWQGRITGEWDNPFNLNDMMSLSINGNADAGKPSSSEAFSLLYSFPLGYWLFETNVNRSQYEQKVSGQISTFNTSGTTDSYGLTAKRLVFRDHQQKLTLFSTLSHKNSSNFVEDTKIAVSSNRLTNLSLGVVWKMQSKGASYDASLTYLKGTTWLGALDDDKQAAGSPAAQGEKTTLSGSYAKGLKLWSQPLQYSLRGQWQFSSDPIFSSEHISLGSLFTVRGFKESRVSSNRGGYVRQEISRPIQNEAISPWILTPYWGLDWGRVHLSASQWEQISGTALGLRASYKALNIDISASHALDEIKGVQGESTLYHVSLNYTF